MAPPDWWGPERPQPMADHDSSHSFRTTTEAMDRKDGGQADGSEQKDIRGPAEGKEYKLRGFAKTY